MDVAMLPAYSTAIAVYTVVFFEAVKSIEFSQLGTGEKAPTTVNYEVDVGANKPIHVTNERFLSFALDDRTLNDGWAQFNFREKAPTTVNYEVDVRANKPIHVTNERFLSFALGDRTLNDGWAQFHFKKPPRSTKLQTLTRALAPAYLRLSGRPADFLVFKNPCSDEETPHGDDVNDLQTYLCPKDWDGINKFCEDTGLKLIFGLNLLLRTKQGGWDPNNAEKLLDYNIHDVAWELGNEPNNFQKIANISLSGTQIGSDFNLFRSVLQSRSRYVGAYLFGPDIADVGRKSQGTKMLGSFLAKTNVTDATTFHSYYLNGKEATVNDFLDPETLKTLPVQIDLVKSLVAEFHGGGSVWLGESGSAYGGGAPNISDRFVAGFLFLDKLGMGAQKGLDVVIRQSYYAGHYTMLDNENLDPKPDYWSAYIYKHLVGRKVLQVQVTPLPKTNESSQETDRVAEKAFVRVYAHCTAATSHSGYYAGAVTLIILNMNKAASASITLEFDKQIIHQYLLTPYGSEGMTASRVKLNGHLFQLVNDTVLPKIEPVLIKRGKPIVLPPLSYGFYVVPKAKAKACTIA